MAVRAEVEHEIQERWKTAERAKNASTGTSVASKGNSEESESGNVKPSGSFLDNWRKKREEMAAEKAAEAPEMVDESEAEVLKPAENADNGVDEAVFKVKR